MRKEMNKATNKKTSIYKRRTKQHCYGFCFRYLREFHLNATGSRSHAITSYGHFNRHLVGIASQTSHMHTGKTDNPNPNRMKNNRPKNVFEMSFKRA